MYTEEQFLTACRKIHGLTAQLQAGGSGTTQQQQIQNSSDKSTDTTPDYNNLVDIMPWAPNGAVRLELWTLIERCCVGLPMTHQKAECPKRLKGVTDANSGERKR